MKQAERCTHPHCRNKRYQQVRNGKVLTSKLCSKHRSQRWRANNPYSDLLIKLRNRARKLDVPCTLTVEELKKFCEDTRYLELRGTSSEGLHIDRIRNEEGYCIHNLQVLTNAQNVRKEMIRRKIERYDRIKAGLEEAEKEYVIENGYRVQVLTEEEKEQLNKMEDAPW